MDIKMTFGFRKLGLVFLENQSTIQHNAQCLENVDKQFIDCLKEHSFNAVLSMISLNRAIYEKNSACTLIINIDIFDEKKEKEIKTSKEMKVDLYEYYLNHNSETNIRKGILDLLSVAFVELFPNV